MERPVLSGMTGYAPWAKYITEMNRYADYLEKENTRLCDKALDIEAKYEAEVAKLKKAVEIAKIINKKMRLPELWQALKDLEE